MLSINKKLRLIVLGLVCSITIGLVVNIILARLPENRNLPRSLDFYFYNWFFWPTLKPPPNLAIIDSHDPLESRSRSDYAAMIRQLMQAGAKCIALDIRFVGERKYDQIGDQELVNCVAEWPQVILAMDFASDNQPSAMAKMKAKQLTLPDSLCQSLFPKSFEKRGVDLPFERLLSVAQHLGHINSFKPQYYHFPPVMLFEERCFAALPVEIARTYLESTDSSFRLSTISTESDGHNSVSSNRLFRMIETHLDWDAQLLVNFISQEAFQPYSYSWENATQLLQYQADTFRDRVVIIVNSSETLVPSPLGPYPGWALLASVASQLLLNRCIEEAIVFDAAFFSSIMVLLGLLWLLFVAPRLDKKWRKTRVIFVAGTGLFLLLIFLLLNLGRQWLGVVVPLFVFNASMLMTRKVYYEWAKPPQYITFGLAVSERQGNKYPVQVFESEVGVDTADISFESFLEEEKFQETLDRIKEWEASQEDIRWIGDKFFNALFQSQVYHLLKNSLDKAQRENKYVRFRLRIDAPELVCLPWELMHSSDLDSEYIALHKRLSLVRFLSLDRPSRKSQYRNPLKILVFISKSRMKDLNVLEEKENIKKALQPLIRSWDVRLRICEQATLENLSRELERRPDILHYIGHADFDEQLNEAYLEFESEHKVFARTLKGLLAESSIQLAILNSCNTAAATKTNAFTGVAQNLVKVGIPAVVAMQLKIPDDTATWFSEIFYAKLLQFHSIAVAVAATRRKIVEKTELDQQHWATPLLFMREGEPILFDSD